MPINVIRGPMASGKTTRLRQLAAECGMEKQVISASTWTGIALKHWVHHLVLRGEKNVFIDECSETLLPFIEKWVSRRFIPADVQVHVVVAAKH